MSQHDFTVANQGFPATRADINSALQALASVSSGASEPSTRFANQFWLDSDATPSCLKMRNNDNDAWVDILFVDQTGDNVEFPILEAAKDDSTNSGVTNLAVLTHTTSGTPAQGIGTGIAMAAETGAGNIETGLVLEAVTADVSSTSEDFDMVLKLMAAGATAAEKFRITSVGQCQLVDGTAALPALSNSGDVNTGLYFSGADEVSVSTAGTQRLSVNSSGHVNLKLSSSADVIGLTSASTVTIDMDTGQNFSCTMAHAITFANPTNANAGQSGSIVLTQDGSGSRTASFGTNWKFVGGTAPTLTTTAAAVDRIDYFIAGASAVHAVVSLDVKAAS
jgi:hypothetical protein